MAGISKVTGGGIVDGTLSVDDIADDAITADKLANSINTDIAKGPAALPKAGGTMTGTIAGFTSTGIDDNANSTAITINPTENVGFGSAPSAWSSSGNITCNSLTSQYENRDICTNAYYSGGWKYVGTGATSNMAVNAGAFYFKTAPSGTAGGAIALTTRLTIAQAGNVKVDTGNLVIGTAGKGIDFNPAGTGAAANLLDDYEEGTWTPTLSGSTTSTVGGKYTKMGNVVHFQAIITWTSGGSGNVLGGLPFTCQGGGANGAYSMTVTPYINTGVSAPPAGKGWMNGYVAVSTTEVHFYWQPISSIVTLQSAGQFYYQGSYLAQ